MAVIDPRIPLQALPQQNMLQAFHEGRMMREQGQMAQMKRKAMQNELATQAGSMLARGVLSSESPEQAYPLALAQARRLGMAVDQLPQQWGPEAEMMTKMLAADPQKRAVWEQKANAMIQNLGMDPQKAYAIATGVVGAHPVTGEPYDLSGQGMLGGGGYGVTPPPSGTQPSAPSSASSDFLPGLDQPSPQELAQTGEEPPGKTQADFPGAFGAEGVLKNVANIASDFVGAGERYPNAAAAKRTIDNLNAQTDTLLATGVDVRGGKYLLDRFREIQTEAAGIEGPEGALKTLQEIRGLLQRAYEINQNIAQSQVKPSEKSNAIATLRRLEPMIEEYGQIINTFQKQYYGSQGKQIPRLGIDVTMEDLKSGDRVMTPDGKIRIVP